MNTTESIAARLTLFANNAPGNNSYKRLCIEAADRLNILQIALGGLLEDSQHAMHNCSSEDCPIMIATKIYCIGKE